jgi:hypothetical protein
LERSLAASQEEIARLAKEEFLRRFFFLARMRARKKEETACMHASLQASVPVQQPGPSQSSTAVSSESVLSSPQASAVVQGTSGHTASSVQNNNITGEGMSAEALAEFLLPHVLRIPLVGLYFRILASHSWSGRSAL